MTLTFVNHLKGTIYPIYPQDMKIHFTITNYFFKKLCTTVANLKLIWCSTTLQKILKNQAHTKHHKNEVMSGWNSLEVEVLVICFVSSMTILQAYHGKLYMSFLTQPILSLKSYNTSGIGSAMYKSRANIFLNDFWASTVILIWDLYKGKECMKSWHNQLPYIIIQVYGLSFWFSRT